MRWKRQIHLKRNEQDFLFTGKILFVLNQVAKCEECKYDFINVDNEFGSED